MKMREGLGLLGSSHGRRWLGREVLQRLHSRRIAVGMRRDLTVPYHVPPSKVPLVVRQLRPDDDLSFISAAPGLAPRTAQERADQRWFLSAGLPTCWVAVDPEGKVCFMAWLLTARDNDLIRERWKGMFPSLQPDEAMVEGIHTAETHRGLGIMPGATNQMMVQAREFGIRYSIGFILGENSASLRGAEKHGCTPFAEREESWFLFRQRIRFSPVASSVSL